MDRFPKLTITGDLGSGKSAVSRLLQKATEYEIFSTGKIQREIAAKHGMSTLELNQYALTHPEIDDEIDDFSKRLGQKQASCIVDSRLAWFFIPHSFKIFLSVDPEVAARRILGDTGRRSETYISLEQAKLKIQARKALENSRFLDLYGADCADLSHFDIVVETSNLTPQAVAEKILQAFSQWRAGGAADTEQ